MKHIAILGGGPSSLFMLKRLLESKRVDIEIHIFEKTGLLGAGMPYSKAGANHEHVTNVSDNEIPQIVTPIHEWIYNAPAGLLNSHEIDPHSFNEYKVLPRLFFGQYLAGQFTLLLKQAKEAGIKVQVHLNHRVLDIIDHPEKNEVDIQTDQSGILTFDACVICTGHHWPVKEESRSKGYFDSPYPPSKLALQLNHAVAIRGSSLTAIDAIRTLSRHNGTFEKDHNGMLSYHLSEKSPDFKMVMHSRSGMLPAIRFHLEDSHLSNHSQLTPELIAENMADNGGFLSLDFVFEKAFKEVFKDKDPEFYLRIKHMNIESFVEEMMELRERLAPFVLFLAEFKEAEKSIRRHESIYWKEMLAVLSFSMNYPAKHFSAEDMQRLQHSLGHLISIVIAFVPQTSAKELLALHAAGVLDIVAVGSDSRVEVEEKGGVTYHYTDHDHKKQAVYYQTFIDSVGQLHLSMNQFPFQSLVKQKAVSQARLKYKDVATGEKEFSDDHKQVEKENDHEYYLQVPGIAINDHFQIIDFYGAYNDRIYMMAVPYISGYNPDYSGLDFCEAASALIVKRMFPANSAEY
ncbi:MAG: FAD/NAD(P)-binding protein [Bacteroidota bacterium]